MVSCIKSKVMSEVRDLVVSKAFEIRTSNSITESGAQAQEENIWRNRI